MKRNESGRGFLLASEDPRGLGAGSTAGEAGMASEGAVLAASAKAGSFSAAAREGIAAGPGSWAGAGLEAQDARPTETTAARESVRAAAMLETGFFILVLPVLAEKSIEKPRAR
jgi:hypothetical protein